MAKNLAELMHSYFSGEYNHLRQTGFGEGSVAENTPFIQGTAIYDFVPSNFRTYTSGTGSAGAENRMFKTSTGAGVGGYGAIQSFRALNYKIGQSGLARFSGLFEGSAENSWQGFGLINIGDELSFGYSGTAFGIWYRYNGLPEQRTITVTGATGGGGETLALTLNGVQYDIPLTSGTVEHNAYEIADWLDTNQGVWGADQLGDTVIISALSDGAKSGTYTYSGSTTTGTIAQDTAGITKTSEHIAQTDWNISTMPSLDPSKGNVYQIKYQDMGFGSIDFSIEDPATGLMKRVHTIRYTNTEATPQLSNPSMRLGMYCVSLGSTTELIVRAESFAGFVQGKVMQTRNPRAWEHTKSVTTSFTNILTIRNRRTYNGYPNQVEIAPKHLTLASESSKNVEVEVRSAVDTGIEHDFTNVGTNLVSDYDTSSGTVTAGRLLATFVISNGATEVIDLTHLEIRLPPTLNIVIQARVTSGASSNVSASLIWYEDV